MSKKRKGKQAGDGPEAKRKRVSGPAEDLSNAEIIDPVEQKRRKAEAAQNKAVTNEKASKPMSKKKQKQLDAYIRRKLKKDDRQQLIASLAKTQVSNLDLQSSSALGSKQFKTGNDKLQHARSVEDSQRARAQAVLEKRKRKDYVSDSESGSESENEGDEASVGELPPPSISPSDPPKKAPFNPSGAVQIEQVKSNQNGTKTGSALATNAKVEVVKRKPKDRSYLRAMAGKADTKQAKSESEDSFDSSDSALDSDEDDADSWHGIDEHSDSAGHDDVETQPDNDEHMPGERSTFKNWAEQQIREAAGQVDSSRDEVPDDGTYRPLLPAGSGQRQAPDPTGITGPLGEHLPKEQVASMPAQRTTFIKINRTDEIEAQRVDLPVVKEEDRIMTAIRGNPVVVVCGETGSGKTTQIGQFLWEAGFGDATSDNPGMVAITQPRRVAALSTCARVRSEMNLPTTSTQVAHRIRYSSTAAADTKLVFMTEGVLLRELASDFLLSKYSVVVIDEAHERGVNTDVLIGVLSRVVRLRESMWRSGKDDTKPLRLVIMSATLRVSDFAENRQLFPLPPPIIEVTARQHPVTMHFSRKTPHNYLDEAYKKVARIHARLPAGGVLVFLTGQNEIMTLVKKLDKKFGPAAVKARKARISQAGQRADEPTQADADDDNERGDDFEAEDIDVGGEDVDLAADVDDGIPPESDPEDLEDDDDGEGVASMLDEEDVDDPMIVLPLYSLLSTEKQLKVFQPPPPGHRLVIVATNVAETSITIPNIRYVVDAGRAKERRYDPASGVQSFEVSWISKASASQRAGRAGRTGPGHCYRLYSSSAFEQFFDDFSKPEILRMPIDGVVLQMKSMNIDAVVNFPFPTPPDRDGLARAEDLLIKIGALERGMTSSKQTAARITALGRSMAMFPLSPRFSKMVISAQANGCLPYVIAIVCALTVGDPFIRETNIGDEDGDDNEAERDVLSAAQIGMIRDPDLRAKEERRLTRRSYFQKQAMGNGSSDVFKLLSVVGAYEFERDKEAFCRSSFVRPKAMDEIHKLRGQIGQLVRSILPEADAALSSPRLAPPTEQQLKMIRQLILSAFIDQVAIRTDLLDKDGGISYARAESTRGVPYRTSLDPSLDLYIHPSSVLFHHGPPEFVVFQELHRTTTSTGAAGAGGSGKTWLKTLTKVNPAWLPVIGKRLCTFSKPLEDPAAPSISAGLTKTGENERRIFVVPRFGPGQGVELKPIQVTQRLVNGRWITM